VIKRLSGIIGFLISNYYGALESERFFHAQNSSQSMETFLISPLPIRATEVGGCAIKNTAYKL